MITVTIYQQVRKGRYARIFHGELTALWANRAVYLMECGEVISIETRDANGLLLASV